MTAAGPGRFLARGQTSAHFPSLLASPHDRHSRGDDVQERARAQTGRAAFEISAFPGEHDRRANPPRTSQACCCCDGGLRRPQPARVPRFSLRILTAAGQAHPLIRGLRSGGTFQPAGGWAHQPRRHDDQRPFYSGANPGRAPESERCACPADAERAHRERRNHAVRADVRLPGFSDPCQPTARGGSDFRPARGADQSVAWPARTRGSPPAERRIRPRGGTSARWAGCRAA